jgi:hypothetical protein
MYTVDNIHIKSKLVFVGISQNVVNLKVFLPEIPELSGKKIVGIQTYDRVQIEGNLSNNNVIAPFNITNLVVINLVDKNKNNVLKDYPFRALKIKRTQPVPRKIITPFFFEFEPTLSYIYLTGQNINIGLQNILSVPINFFYI